MDPDRSQAEPAAEDRATATPDALFRAHAQAVFAVCLANTRNHHDAEDLMQAVFLKAVSKISSLREPARARAWLLQAARRQATDRHNERQAVGLQLAGDVRLHGQAVEQRYHKEVQAMLEKRLTGTRRWGWLGAAIMGLVFALGFGSLAVVAPADFPWWGRLIFAAGVPFGIGWALLGLKVFRRGSLDLKSDTWAANGMAWALPVLVVTVAMVFAPDNVVGLRMILSALVFLVMGAAFLVRHVIEQSELKTREKLLEIESVWPSWRIA
jgi:hypothetical protein